jgi:polysaccharide pyruvyl transferase WcaK-like protein
LVPNWIRESATYLCQNVDQSLSWRYGYKLKLAVLRLKQIEQAKLVITNRLHVALPCLAIGTPCVFMHESAEHDNRLGDYLPFLNYSSSRMPLENFDWENPLCREIPEFVTAMTHRIKKSVFDNP